VYGQESERLGTSDIVFLVTFQDDLQEPSVQVFPRAIYREMVNSKFTEAISLPVQGGYYLAVIAPSGYLQLVRANIHPAERYIARA
jgi:hypothetical protein